MTNQSELDKLRIAALERIVLQLCVSLHARGTLPLQELIPKLESADYALVATDSVAPNQALQQMILSLSAIAKHGN